MFLWLLQHLVEERQQLGGIGIGSQILTHQHTQHSASGGIIHILVSQNFRDVFLIAYLVAFLMIEICH